MKIFKLWEKLFLALGAGEVLADALNLFLTGVSAFFIIVWFLVGAMDANIASECRINKLADIVFTAPYALGCNLFKDRFDVKVN